MKFKIPLAKRKQQAQYKLSNWEKIKVYQREYMRDWRKREPGKTIVRIAQAAYHQRNALTFSMYAQLRKLVKEDGRWGRKDSYKTTNPGNWKIKRAA